MLDWRNTNGAWFGNGFRIERRSPSTWVVLDNNPESEQRLEEPVLATMPSLKSAKHAAETRHSSEKLRQDRKRLAIVALSMTVLLFLFIEVPIAAIASGVLAAAAVLELGATYVESFYGKARKVTQ